MRTESSNTSIRCRAVAESFARLPNRLFLVREQNSLVRHLLTFVKPQAVVEAENASSDFAERSERLNQ